MQKWCSEPCINLCLLEYLLLVGVCAGYKWVPAGRNRNIFDSFLELTTASIPCFTTPNPQINHLGQFGGTGRHLTLPASRIQCLTFLWTGTTSLHLRLQRYSRSNLCSRCHLNRVLLLSSHLWMFLQMQTHKLTEGTPHPKATDSWKAGNSSLKTRAQTLFYPYYLPQ